MRQQDASARCATSRIGCCESSQYYDDVGRIVVKPSTGARNEIAHGAEPLEDTGLYVVDATDPRALVDKAGAVEWAAPTIGEEREESYPTGELSVRFSAPIDDTSLVEFVRSHGLELRRRNEFVPEQVVVAPADPHGTWLPDLVDRLNEEGRVASAWPNTLSRYERD
jgi:hypothetical protein